MEDSLLYDADFVESVKAIVNLRIAENNYEMYKQEHKSEIEADFSKAWENGLKSVQSLRDNAKRKYDRYIDDAKHEKSIVKQLKKIKHTPESFCSVHNLIKGFKI